MSAVDNEDRVTIRHIAAVAGVTLVLGALLAFGIPLYNVYHQHQAGRAELAKAEYTKQVLVQEAMAKKDAAKSLADAEVVRAEGVAKANKIIGESLQGNIEYLQYLWIHNLEAGNNAVIYIPTEAGLPILEAGGRFHPRRSERPNDQGRQVVPTE